MKIKYIAKTYKPSSKFKEILEKKIDKLEKYFTSDADAKVNLSQIGNFYKLELTINSKGAFFRSEVTSDNMYTNIDLALPKLERQLVKFSDRFASKLKKDAFENPELLFLNEKPEKVESSVVRVKRFELVPITVDEAISQMEALGHAFYIFLNLETDKVSVVYKRDGGDVGLIEVTY